MCMHMCWGEGAGGGRGHTDVSLHIRGVGLSIPTCVYACFCLYRYAYMRGCTYVILLRYL